jgi:hypothetical protein
MNANKPEGKMNNKWRGHGERGGQKGNHDDMDDDIETDEDM